ncbi:MAG: hypothetical protein MPK62_04125, partial [Alphaproteobacteria bacterium]|nr:hypothetical protein [Alphaproteobacteria bacterium]
MKLDSFPFQVLQHFLIVRDPSSFVKEGADFLDNARATFRWVVVITDTVFASQFGHHGLHRRKMKLDSFPFQVLQ